MAAEDNLLALFRAFAFLKFCLLKEIPTNGVELSPNLKKSLKLLVSFLFPEATHLKFLLKFKRLSRDNIYLAATANFSRPMALLRDRTFLPPMVAILCMKPCFLTLFCFLG